MPDPALTVFGLSFVAGPVIVAMLLRLLPRLGVLIMLSGAVICASALAVWLQTRAPLGALAAFWTGWLVAVAMVAQALRRRMPGPRLHRLTLLGALFAAPLPWFGLATAQMMD